MYAMWEHTRIHMHTAAQALLLLNLLQLSSLRDSPEIVGPVRSSAAGTALSVPRLR